MAMNDDLGEKLLQKKKSLRKRVWEESKKIWVVAGPAIFTKFSTFGTYIITQAFIGHFVGSTELVAYALVMITLCRFITGKLVSLSFSCL
jgi:multidrug resistance protein, MATE family